MTPLPFDLWDSATFTQIVRESTDAVFAQDQRIATQFAPVVDTASETIARGRVKLHAVGKGRGVVADDATPPIYRPSLRFTEEAFNLMRLTEMTPVEESLRRKLEINGNDPESQAIRDKAGADIITRTRAIAVRQETLSDYIVMQAVLNGSLQVTAANPPAGSTMNNLVIDYEYPTGAVTQSAYTIVDTVNSKPVDYLRAQQAFLRAQNGKYGTEFWMSSEVMNYILLHPDTIARFGWGGSTGQPPQVTENMLKTLLYTNGSQGMNGGVQNDQPGSDVVFHITDEGWYDETAGFGSGMFGMLDADKTRWIPKDTVICMVTSPANDPFAQMFNGLCPIQTSWDDFTYQQGPVSYWQLLQGNLTRHARWEARRFPMIHHPERISVMKVVF